MMAAAAKGPLGFKFQPTDDVLMAHYLVPRIRGHRIPDGVFLEVDPLSAPPWEMLAKNGCQDKEAFLFAAGHSQARGGGGGVDVINWRKHVVLHFRSHGEKGSSGWVMDEFAVTAPPELAASSGMAYHIRFSGHNTNKRKRDQHTDARAMVEETTSTQLEQEHPPATAPPPQPMTPTLAPAVVAIDPEPTAVTLPDQGSSSGVVDFDLSIPMDLTYPLFSLDDFISPSPTMVDSALSSSAADEHGTAAAPSDDGSCAAMTPLTLPDDIEELMQCFSYE